MSDKKPRTKAAPPRDASAPLSTNADVHEGAAASVAVQVVPIGKLKANPKNPRVLRDEKFAKLKKSLTDFPDMLNKRPLVGVTDTDGKIMVLGGNMRLRALQDLKATEAPVILADEWTEEQRREFIIKDNVAFGEHDWDQLANEWDAGELSDWGVDVPIAQDFSGANAEIDTDAFGDEVVIKLKYSTDDHAKVREALARIAASPEQAVWKLLGFA